MVTVTIYPALRTIWDECEGELEAESRAVPPDLADVEWEPKGDRPYTVTPRLAIVYGRHFYKIFRLPIRPPRRSRASYRKRARDRR